MPAEALVLPRPHIVPASHAIPAQAREIFGKMTNGTNFHENTSGCILLVVVNQNLSLPSPIGALSDHLHSTTCRQTDYNYRFS